MPSSYLLSADYSTFGVPNATAAQVQQASAIVDAAIGRPEGLAWAAGADGSPCYMAGLDPTGSLALPASIAPGANVAVAAPAYICRPDMLGQVVVLDRADITKTEAAVISAVGAASITLDKVTYAHAQGSFAEWGLVITEERPLPAKRTIGRIMRTPVVRVISALGRYGQLRRSQSVGMAQGFNLLAISQTFGGPPPWTLMDCSQISASPTTGELWLPQGIYGVSWSEFKANFVCGYNQTTLPSQLRTACAKIVAQLQTFPEISGNVRLYKAGDTEVQRFTDSVLDAETKAYLDPFRLRAFV
ncbi:hypothetical protein GCM10007036_14360 [Alsobacter metallidurans]|uniref:Uncharacterized protein n=1 Tax=Alsobacter metallidurans TaxID=340221 RepID=A0A917I6G4_9HYPH|nr:hypothetical protein [Alsobacter metallidurans]GGH14804.1 hypothetical protein GCM10007036_14360 [Alsobacter metallidurans]